MLYSYSFMDEVDPIIYAVFANGGIDKAGEHVCEIIDAIHRGTAKVDFGKVIEAISNDDTAALKRAFNVEAYVNTIKKNRRLAENTETKKNLHICDVDDEGIAEPYGVPESVVSWYVEQKDEYEEFIDLEEAYYAVEQLYRMRSELMIEYRLDIIVCMKQAARGIPQSIASLKNLVAEVPQIGEFVKIILSSGKPLNELFGAA